MKVLIFDYFVFNFLQESKKNFFKKLFFKIILNHIKKIIFNQKPHKIIISEFFKNRLKNEFNEIEFVSYEDNYYDNLENINKNLYNKYVDYQKQFVNNFINFDKNIYNLLNNLRLKYNETFVRNYIAFFVKLDHEFNDKNNIYVLVGKSLILNYFFFKKKNFKIERLKSLILSSLSFYKFWINFKFKGAADKGEKTFSKLNLNNDKNDLNELFSYKVILYVDINRVLNNFVKLLIEKPIIKKDWLVLYSHRVKGELITKLKKNNINCLKVSETITKNNGNNFLIKKVYNIWGVFKFLRKIKVLKVEYNNFDISNWFILIYLKFIFNCYAYSNLLLNYSAKTIKSKKLKIIINNSNSDLSKYFVNLSNKTNITTIANRYIPFQALSFLDETEDKILTVPGDNLYNIYKNKGFKKIYKIGKLNCSEDRFFINKNLSNILVLTRTNLQIPYDIDDINFYFDNIKEVIKINKQLKFTIKDHPIANTNDIFKFFPDYKNSHNLSFIDNNKAINSELINDYDLVLTYASSANFEILQYNKPLVIVCSKKIINKTKLYYEILFNNCQVFNDQVDLLNFFKNNITHKELRNMIIKQSKIRSYFYKKNEKNDSENEFISVIKKYY